MSVDLISSISEKLLQPLQNPGPFLLRRQKNYIIFSKDLWTRNGGSLPIPTSDDYQVTDAGKMIKIFPKLVKVASHMLTPDFFNFPQSDLKSGFLNVHSRIAFPLSQVRAELAKEILGHLSPKSLDIHVEPVLNSQRAVTEMTLEEALDSLKPTTEQSKCDTFGQLQTHLPRGELVFKLLSSSLRKPVIFQSDYSTKLTFILYNAARIKQILQAYILSYGSFPQEVNLEHLSDEGTLLVSYLSNYHSLLEKIRWDGSIHALPLFLTDFIGEFSRYYRVSRILRESPHLKGVMETKIHFLRFVLYFLHHALCILNISCLEPWVNEYCRNYLLPKDIIK